MKYISDIIASFERKLAMILMFAMAVIVVLAVFFRYVLNLPLVWAGEVSIFLLIYITFLGGSLGLKYKTQASVTVLTDYFSEKIKQVVGILGHLLMLMFLAIIIFYSYKWLFSPNVAIQKSSAILLPMWIPYSIVPVGLTFASIHIVHNLIELIKGGDSK